jgi:hypothetical protein
LVTTGDFPQADKIMQVGEVARAVKAGNQTDKDIEKYIGLASQGRQGRYYRLAAQILGLVVNQNNNSVLTELGEEYATLTSVSARREFLARCLVETTVFAAALSYIRQQSPTNAQLRVWFRNYYPGEKSTADRRYSTFVAYLQEARLVEDAGSQLRASGVSVAVLKQHKTIKTGIAGKPVNKTFIEGSSSGAKQTIKIEIDAQKRERANQTHWNLITAKTAFLTSRKMPAEENYLIDLFSTVNGDTMIYEMKSLSGMNLSSQVRRAIAQLYEYRYIFSIPTARLCIVTNAQIAKSDGWLIDYLAADRQIAYEWTTDFSSFECAPNSKSLLAGFAP